MTLVQQDLLSTSVRRLFGEDPYPEQSWALMAEQDRSFVLGVAGADVPDPGLLQVGAGPDERRRHRAALEDWHHSWPYLRTRQTAGAEMQYRTVRSPQPRRTADLIPITLITGPPGTGKTKLMRRVAAETMCHAAWDARIGISAPLHDDGLFAAPRRDVVVVDLPKKQAEQQLFALLCQQVGAPFDKDARAAFVRAVERHRIRWVFVDEIQFINFDGQTGKYVHDGFKSLQNMGVRVVLAGHDMRQQLAAQRSGAREAARVQSEARWMLIELEPYRRSTKTEMAEWKKLLQRIEQRIRLSGHTPGEAVLSEEFEEYLWVATLGYMSHVSTLVSGAVNVAAATADQRITRKILDMVAVEQRAQDGRAQRLQLWDAGRFSFRQSWR